jgi:hypothetical protein
MRGPALIATILLGAAMSSPVWVEAHPASKAVFHLDQSFQGLTDANLSLNSGSKLAAQTYRANLTGRLAAVSVQVVDGGTERLRVSIWATAGGLPTHSLGSHLLETSEASFTDIITFAEHIPQVAGEIYAIVLDYPTAPPNEAQGTWSASSVSQNYPGGGLYTSNDGSTWSIASGAAFSADAFFKTYVAADACERAGHGERTDDRARD